MTSMPRRTYAALAATTAVLTLAACGNDDSGDDAEATATPSATTATTEPTTSAPPASGATGEFRPGEYEAIGSYTTPDGRTQKIEVEVDLAADGTITDLDADGQAEGGNSEQYQKKFESGIDQQVVGRKITELDVDKVSGSSLTSGGFNSAIKQIISQAQA